MNTNNTPREEANRLWKIFGDRSFDVVDELVSMSELGHDSDKNPEISFFCKVKEELRLIDSEKMKEWVENWNCCFDETS